MSNKNQKSVSLTHGGYHVRVVLDRKGIAYPIWGGAIPVDPIRAFFGGVKIKDQSGRLPSADVRKKVFAAFFTTRLSSWEQRGWQRYERDRSRRVQRTQIRDFGDSQ